jgi:hypothetical protein
MPLDDSTATTEESPAGEVTPAPAVPEPSPAIVPEPSQTTAAEQVPGSAGEVIDHGAALWGRTFVVVAITEGGQPKLVVPDPHPWTTSFVYRSDLDPPQRQIGWRWGGCNRMGADVEVKPDRLRLLAGIGGTAVGCPHEESDEVWSREFFSSDPYWRLEGDRLWLWSGDTVVELEDRTDD